MSGHVRWLVVSALFVSSAAYAINDQNQNGAQLDIAKLSQNPTDCDSFCGNIVNQLAQKPASIDGTGEWSPTDDQWCANHGAQTSPSVPPVNPLPKPNPDVKCNIPVLAGDPDCNYVNKAITHCKVKGSQLETQCLAYAAASKSDKGEKIVLAFDIAATATCTTACVATVFTGGAGQIACNVAGGAASGAELLHTLFGGKDQSPTQRALGAITGGVGAATIAGNISRNGLSGSQTITYAGGLSKAPNVTLTRTGANTFRDNFGRTFTGDPSRTGGLTGADGKVFDGSPPSDQVRGAQEGRTGRKQACFAAATFGAMTGIRAYSMSKQKGTKKQACEAVQGLIAGALAPGFSAAAVGTTSAAVNTNGNTAVNTSVRTSNAVLGSAGSFSASDVEEAMNDAGANTSAATDAGLLKSSGLVKALAAQAANLPIDQMVKHLENGGTADALIQSALGGGGGPLGASIASLAKTAQLEAPTLGGVGQLSTPTMAGGSMPAANPAAGENPFKLMGQNEGNLGGATSQAFAKPVELNGAQIGDDGDIFHSRFQGSIFEIVSHSIKKASDRVEKVGYADPMNRAIAGQQ